MGFITATSDGALSAAIRLLEVLEAYQGQGIGSELLRRMLLAAQAPSPPYAALLVLMLGLARQKPLDPIC